MHTPRPLKKQRSMSFHPRTPLMHMHHFPMKSAPSLAKSSSNSIFYSSFLSSRCYVSANTSTVDYRHELPLLVCMTDLLSFIDRVNIGNARVAGLQKDLNMTDYQYSLVLTITYVPYILVEIPAALVVKRIGANNLLPIMAIIWGLITTLQGLVTSYSGLLATRFFLGLAEGGLIPGIMLVMSRFYKRDQMQLRLAIFWSAASLTGAFSGLLASAIIGMDGRAGHRGWQWIFILVRDPCTPSLLFIYFIFSGVALRSSGGIFHCGVRASVLLRSPADSHVFAVSHSERERSHSRRVRTRLDARLGGRGILVETCPRCVYNPPRESIRPYCLYRLDFLGTLAYFPRFLCWRPCSSSLAI